MLDDRVDEEFRKYEDSEEVLRRKKTRSDMESSLSVNIKSHIRRLAEAISSPNPDYSKAVDVYLKLRGEPTKKTDGHVKNRQKYLSWDFCSASQRDDFLSKIEKILAHAIDAVKHGREIDDSLVEPVKIYAFNKNDGSFKPKIRPYTETGEKNSIQSKAETSETKTGPGYFNKPNLR